jgi:hypothetical protein
VLGTIGCGARRRSRIAGRAQQRIDYTLERLRRSGYVQRVVPLGHAMADPLYEIADTYGTAEPGFPAKVYSASDVTGWTRMGT